MLAESTAIIFRPCRSETSKSLSKWAHHLRNQILTTVNMTDIQHLGHVSRLGPEDLFKGMG